MIRVWGGHASTVDIVDIEARDPVSARLSDSLVLKAMSTNHGFRAASMLTAVVAVAQPP